MNNQIQLEELLTSIAALTEYNSALQEQLTVQSQASTQQAQETARLIAQLTDQLNQYQRKEQHLTANTNQAIANNITTAFQKNARQYQVLINQGFTTHIDTATQQLSLVSQRITQQLNDLEVSAQQTQKEFESRNDSMLTYEKSYQAQSKKLQANVAQTLDKVSKDTEMKLMGLADDFIIKLSWKITGTLGLICLSLVILTYGMASFFIPSKADIDERREQYDYLEKASLLEKITKIDGKYYAEIDYSGNACKKNADNGKRWCKFK